MARFPWPFRRSVAAVEPVVEPQPAVEAEPGVTRSPDPQPQSDAATVGHGPAVDGDFATAFRGRADARTGAPLLGPWGGLGDTARFVVEASHLSETFATQRWVDQAATAPNMIEDPTEFAAGLPSFASLANPFALGSGSEQIFADSLPAATGTDTFRDPPARAVPVQTTPAGVRRAVRGSVPPAAPARTPLGIARRVDRLTRRSPVTTATVPSRSPLGEGRAGDESRMPAGGVRREPGEVGPADATTPLISEAAGATPVAEYAGESAGERSVDEAIQARVVEAMALPLSTARRLAPESAGGSAPAIARVGRRVSDPVEDVTGSREPSHAAPPPAQSTADPGTLVARSPDAEGTGTGAGGGTPPIAETRAAGASDAMEVVASEQAAAGARDQELPVARLVAEASDEAPPVSEHEEPGGGAPNPSMGTPLAGGRARRFTVGEPYEGTLPLGTGEAGSVTQGGRMVDRAGTTASVGRVVETGGGTRASPLGLDGSGRPAMPGGTVAAPGGVPVPLVVGRTVEPIGSVAGGTAPHEVADRVPVAGAMAGPGDEALVAESDDLPLVQQERASEVPAQGTGGTRTEAPIQRGSDPGVASSAKETRGSSSRQSLATTMSDDRSPASLALFANAAAEPIREAANWELDTTGLQRTVDSPAARQQVIDLPTSPMASLVTAGSLPSAQRTASLPLGPGGQAFGADGTSPGGFAARGRELSGGGGGPGSGAFGTISVTPNVPSRTVSASDGGFVSREAEAAETVTTQSTAAGPDAETNHAPMEQDIDSLAEKVWQRVRTKLLHERERRRGLP